MTTLRATITSAGMLVATAVVVACAGAEGAHGYTNSGDGSPASEASAISTPSGSSPQQFDPMEFIIPLYIPPFEYENDNLVLTNQWALLKDTALAGVAVIGIMNPASGPGTSEDLSYRAAIDEVQSSGAKLVCYVATGYGVKSEEAILADVEAYNTLYPGACDGIFYDETPRILSLGSLTSRYSGYNTLAHSLFDTPEVKTRVMFNPGQHADAEYFEFSPPAGVVGFENYYWTMDGLPVTPDSSRGGSNVLFVHSAWELGQNEDLIYEFMGEAYCKGWSPIYVTDDTMPNPWDAPPTFWNTLLDAAKAIPTSC